MARRGVFQPGCEAWIGFEDAGGDFRIHYRMDREHDVFSTWYGACRIRNGVCETVIDEDIPIERRPSSRLTLKLAVLPEGLR